MPTSSTKAILKEEHVPLLPCVSEKPSRRLRMLFSTFAPEIHSEEFMLFKSLLFLQFP